MTREDKAILDMIAFAEGTIGISNNGYDVCVGHYIINGWTSDTNIVHGGTAWLNKSLDSTAAGRYQFTIGTWIGNSKINQPMTKENQDNKCIALVNSKIGKIDKTNLVTNRALFNSMLSKLGSTWTSLPIDGDRKSYHKNSKTQIHDKTPKSGDQIYSIFKEALGKY